ncbi:CapA family protein [Fervidobacterium islandicum]|uniref:CapA family protein n=1 Tax=Fervidobacterium islandicum TaxID=2423 RepID=A0AAI8CLV9_FERIS|nr:CapA family protein [Fervidobacterium islandicum]AMW32807.1 CapA family protein [Fervidobacterium islandicum]
MSNPSKFCKSFACFFFLLIFILKSSIFSTQITFSFVGDVMFHMPTINSAYSNGRYDFKNIFSYVKKYIEKSDIAFCNLETTLGGQPYTGYPQFSSPDEVLDALKFAGFDIINVANNHMLDRSVQGLKQTITKVSKYGLTYVGARLTPLEKLFKVVEVKGFKISFASFTYSTNGISTDEKHKYMFMYISKPAILSVLDEMKKASDIVIIYFHYGNEYQTRPTKEQIELAYFALDNGADMVIASHPHVLQRIELVKCGLKTKLIAYSLGNFLSNMTTSGTDEGVILDVAYHPVKGVIDVNPILTWVHRYKIGNKIAYRILPVKDFFESPDRFLTESDVRRLSQIAQKKLLQDETK